MLYSIMKHHSHRSYSEDLHWIVVHLSDYRLGLRTIVGQELQTRHLLQQHLVPQFHTRLELHQKSLLKLIQSVAVSVTQL